MVLSVGSHRGVIDKAGAEGGRPDKVADRQKSAAASREKERKTMNPRRKPRQKKLRYTSDLARRLYTYFISYSEPGAPSISKFARSIGATTLEVESWREHKLFERAYRECSEIRRDYLIDSALAKKNDASLTKFLLSTEFRMGDDAISTDNAIDVRLEVVE